MYALEKIFAETSHTKSYRDQNFLSHFFHLLCSQQCAMRIFLSLDPSALWWPKNVGHGSLGYLLTSVDGLDGVVVACSLAQKDEVCYLSIGGAFD